MSYASEIITYTPVLHYYETFFGMEHFISDPQPSGWASRQWKSMGQIFKSKTRTYLTGGGIFFLYGWTSIEIRMWANVSKNPATLEIIMLFKSKVGANF